MKISRQLISLILAIGALSACSSEQETQNTNAPQQDTSSFSLKELPVSIDAFDKNSIIGTPSIVDCKLSGGTETTCLSITLKPQPASFEIGPWCPRNISDGADLSGIWLEDGKVYDADGSFIQNLSKFYDDDAWQMFDPKTGKINVTDTEISCRAAARPDVDPAYKNHCVECSMSYLEEGLSQTYIIPLKPVKTSRIAPRVAHSGVGIAFSGVRLDAPAPVDDILSAHTLAPFDDCGGHINPFVGYHAHAVTNCLVGISVSEDHAEQIGLAMDGYPIHSQLNPDGNEPADLDACRGHATEAMGYHYHVASAGANAIISCHSGETGCTLNSSDDVCDASADHHRAPPPPHRHDEQTIELKIFL